jgi:hypothetical protein
VKLIGWVIVHPNGWVETDYFNAKKWIVKGVAMTRRTWRKHYRPDCKMVQATMVVPSNALLRKAEQG